MQRRQRKTTARQRNPRAARNPAYQIKPRYHLAPENAAEGHTETWDSDAVRPVDDTEWQKPGTPPISDDPEETSFQPEIPDHSAALAGTTAEVPTVVAEEPQPEAQEQPEPVTQPDADLPADVEKPQEAAVVQPEAAEDFSTYVRKIEEAAARSRAEHRGTALAGHRPIASVAQHPAAATPHQTPAVRGRRPSSEQLVSGRGGGNGNARRRTAPPPPAPKPFFRRRRTWFVILALLIVVPLVVALLYAGNVLRLGIDAYGTIHTEPVNRERFFVNPQGTPEAIPEEMAESVVPDWGQDDVVNIVLMGVDERNDDGEYTRSDTIIVVHVDPRGGDITMMSIPRDLWVYIPGHGDDKMNASYAIGDANQDTIPGGGPTLVAQTIEANFNIPIHYYATIDFAGFRKIVDSVGGIIVDVPSQLSDNLYPTDDLRLTRVYFSSGLQSMDGQEALEYVRTRHADSDIARGQRQQQVLMAIRERAIVRDLITRAPELIDGVSETLRTDLDFNQMLALANLGRQIDPANIARIDLWQEGILTEHFPEFEGDAYYLDADWNRIHELQAEFFEIPEPVATSTPDTVAGAPEPTEELPEPTPTVDATDPDLDTPVMVENGTEIPVLAGHTAQFLFDSGFTAVWASDADEPAEETVIYDSSSNSLTAEYLAELLGLDSDVIVRREGNNDIVVVIGDDFPRVEAEVNVGP